MNPSQLLSHFDRISDAPDAIPCLRRFILDLAVRGKLVEQDSRDEAASELLKRIQAEKARLVKEGEIRREQPLPPIGIQELPSESPDNWKWARLGDTSTLITKGSTPTSYGHAFVPSGINFIKVESIKDGRLVSENVTSFISEQTHNFLARSRLAAGDILFSIAGSIGTCARVAPNILPANTNQALAIIRGTDLVFDAEFLLICLKSSIAHLVLAKARGGAMNNVSLDDIRNFVVPIPPLAEQQRIVAKVDELMALCDRLEAAQTERESHRDRLVILSLHQLNNGADPDAFREHARFYFNHLPRLTTKLEHIKHLRQTVLNLAVRGKLVTQDLNDEPVSELLKQIQTEKARRVSDGKLRSNTAITPIEPEEGHFTIPVSWVWVPFGEVMISRDGERIPVSKEDRNQRAKVYDYYGASGVIDKIDGYLFDKPLLLIGEDGANLINRSTPIAFIARGKYWVNNHAHVLDGISEDFLRFIELHINAIDLKPYVTGAAQPKMNQAKMNSIPIALPPLAEQNRIVAKVDELMALCDRLEAQLTTTQTESRRLLEAILHEALTGADRQELAATSCRSNIQETESR